MAASTVSLAGIDSTFSDKGGSAANTCSPNAAKNPTAADMVRQTRRLNWRMQVGLIIRPLALWGAPITWEGLVIFLASGVSPDPGSSTPAHPDTHRNISVRPGGAGQDLSAIVSGQAGMDGGVAVIQARGLL